MACSVCTLAAAVATGPNLTSWFLGAQLSMFNQYNRADLSNAFPVSYVVLLYLSADLLGFALGGFACRFLVWPGDLIWPEQLQTGATLTALHGVRRGIWSRRKVFWIVMIVTFVVETVPRFVSEAMQAFAWPTWIAPFNYAVNLMFGGQSGMGLGFFTFDWITVIAALGSPLCVPWYGILNVFGGFLVAACLIPVILIFTNSNMAAHLPYREPAYSGGSLSWVLANNTVPEAAVNASLPLPQGLDVQPDAVFAHGNPTTGHMTALLTSSTAWAYAACTALLVHTALYHWHGIRHSWALPSPAQSLDPHTKQMGRYKQVPSCWHGALLLIALALAIPMVHWVLRVAT